MEAVDRCPNLFKHYADEETWIVVSNADMWADFNGATKTARGSPTLCQRCDTNNPDDNVHTAFYIAVHHGDASGSSCWWLRPTRLRTTKAAVLELAP